MMSFTRWVALIGIMVVVGSAQVAQQTAIRLQAYELGHRQVALHELENDTLWLKSKVIGLQSPARLVKSMQGERSKLVAWSELESVLKPAQLARADQPSKTAARSE